MFNKIMRAAVVFVSLVSISTIGGCGVITGEFQLHQKIVAENEARDLAQKKDLENLPKCAIANPLHKSDFSFPYRSIVVHVKSIFFEHDFSKKGASPGGNPQMDTYFKSTVKQLLSEKGYKVTLGRNIGEDEFLATTERCSAPYDPNISNKLFEVRHNRPLFMKLIAENGYPKSYDAVMLLKYSYGNTSRIFIQLFDASTKMIVMSTNQPIEGEKNKKYGSPYIKKIGNETYQATPYSYVGSDEALLESTLSRAFKYIPSWSGGEFVLPESYCSGNVGFFTPFLIWQDQVPNKARPLD